MNIAYCTAEMVPFAKTGGLADVAGSLPEALSKLGHQIMVVMPKYRNIKQSFIRLRKNLSVTFVENPKFFDRAGLYGNEKGDYPDNLERFSYFCFTALELLKQKNFRPDIIHNQDWHTGLVGVYLKTLFFRDEFFKNSKILYTIHNLAYQGLFDNEGYGALRLDMHRRVKDSLEFYQKINFLKGGIVHSDALSTVSPTYAKQIQTKEGGCGLEGVIRPRKHDLSGILNGIDQNTWNPQTDHTLPQRYSGRTLHLRIKNKLSLQRRASLTVDEHIPLIGMVSRLVEQKGLDLLMRCFPQLMKRKLQLVILGMGEKRIEDFLRRMQKKYPGRVSCFLRFEALKAPLIYAGSDFFLMPSRFEPCGLGQLISFRYGAIPLARKTGGIADTVIDVSQNQLHGNGIMFTDYKASGFLGALDRALKLHEDSRMMAGLRRRGMSLDYSWNRSAREYAALYRKMGS